MGVVGAAATLAVGYLPLVVANTSGGPVARFRPQFGSPQAEGIARAIRDSTRATGAIGLSVCLVAGLIGGAIARKAWRATGSRRQSVRELLLSIVVAVPAAGVLSYVAFELSAAYIRASNPGF
jgi:hypothetical protein